MPLKSLKHGIGTLKMTSGKEGKRVSLLSFETPRCRGGAYKEPLHSGDLKSNHVKSGISRNPDFLMFGFQMVWFSNGRAMAIAIAPTIRNGVIH